jgi:hypothetical protein
MGGGLMQLVAYGAQDIYLTGNPQITFFKVVYRRHTNFAMEAIEQTFNGDADWGKRVTATISRNGDLIHRMYLEVTLPPVQCSTTSKCFRWVNYVGHVLIRQVEIEIGGQKIDKHYGDWLTIWNELTQQPGLQVGYDNMVGNTIALTGTGLNRTEATTLYVPFQFWFCRNPGLALPLIALQYHEVKVNIEFRPAAECIVSCQGSSGCCGEGGPGVIVPRFESASLFVDYIYLDTDERRRFAQVSHEYLIEQLQFTGDESVVQQNVKVKLNFNHPCKELIWVVQRDDVCNNGWNQWNNYTDNFDTDNLGPKPAPNSCPVNCQAVNTNVEAGYMAKSFPHSRSIQQTSWDPSGDNSYANGGVLACGSADGSSPQCGVDPTSDDYKCGNLNVGANGNYITTDMIATALGDGNPLGYIPLPGGTQACNPISTAATNLGAATRTDAWLGLDHAGLAPRNAGRNPTQIAKLQLNGHDRFTERLGSYFNLVQPYQHHTNVPATGINVYSFALRPEEHQPSGTCNFSRIDSAVLQLVLTPNAAGPQKCEAGVSNITVTSKIRVYAINYNVLRIMSGMGGLAYSN